MGYSSTGTLDSQDTGLLCSWAISLSHYHNPFRRNKRLLLIRAARKTSQSNLRILYLEIRHASSLKSSLWPVYIRSPLLKIIFSDFFLGKGRMYTGYFPPSLQQPKYKSRKLTNSLSFSMVFFFKVFVIFAKVKPPLEDTFRISTRIKMIIPT